MCRLTETYQNQQVAAVYAYGGYMYGQPAAGYYDYSQMANYNQYAAVNTSVSSVSSVCAVSIHVRTCCMCSPV